MSPRIEDVLHAQLDHTHVNVRWVLEDLSDDEYLWEPSELCWSIRPRSSGRVGWGSGSWICEDQWPPPDPVPVPTIAWRVVHLAAWVEIYRNWAFEDATLGLPDFEIPADARGGLRWLDAALDDFANAVAALDDGEAFSRRLVHWGEYLPVVHIVTSIINEQVHHVAEIGLLRDLRRGRARRQPPPEIGGPPWWQAQPDSDTGSGPPARHG